MIGLDEDVWNIYGLSDFYERRSVRHKFKLQKYRNRQVTAKLKNHDRESMQNLSSQYFFYLKIGIIEIRENNEARKVCTGELEVPESGSSPASARPLGQWTTEFNESGTLNLPMAGPSPLTLYSVCPSIALQIVS